MLESLYNKVLPCNFFKKRLHEYCEVFKNTFFYRTHPVSAFEVKKWSMQYSSNIQITGGININNNAHTE